MKRLCRAKAAAQWIEKKDFSKFGATSLPTGQAGNFSSL